MAKHDGVIIGAGSFRKAYSIIFPYAGETYAKQYPDNNLAQVDKVLAKLAGN
ncbi:MAG: hypothetical protein Q8M92_03615 [Candidatus Subteraquimicrobiales bacterium]|nr:hypothetical protein [Candidatus Subteraquimicrobiales bacterium]